MKKKNRMTIFAMAALGVALCLAGSGCGAKEEALFVDNSEMAEEKNTLTEESKAMDEDLALENADAAAGNVSATTGDAGEAAEDTKAQAEAGTNLSIVVHVCGAVNEPGVYELAEDCRVMDAVLAAGGLREDADSEYVNLAATLSDGDKVRIPTKEEVTQMSQVDNGWIDNGVITPQTQKNTEENGLQKVNINTADKELLCTLPGIGETRAESILTYRSEHGSFSQIEDIMQVSGIKESSFQKIKDQITVK